MRQEWEQVLAEIEKVIAGKRAVIEKILMALLAEGHVLMDDVPGVGKTTLAVAISRAIGLEYRRVQFTPDVLPSDLVGFSLYDKDSGDFLFRPGVVSQVNLLLGDEINRASSKTQSALLEAMEEKQVSVDGNTYPLQKPFLVIATENSVGAAGTQLLPFAQMDRFLVRLSLGYPDYEAQMALLRARQGSQPMDQVQTVLSKDRLCQMQREAQQVTAKEEILDYITRLTLASHDQEELELGISPRGALFLDRAAKAKAYLAGRDYVTGTDVREVFLDVCTHRVLLTEQARREGKSVEGVLRELLKKVETPDHHGLTGWKKR
ncbi:MAG: MoxR family ATPase [Clostridia bacterium]|nr:MoxR family ATPase [Clostridia bacterium]